MKASKKKPHIARLFSAGFVVVSTALLTGVARSNQQLQNHLQDCRPQSS